MSTETAAGPSPHTLSYASTPEALQALAAAVAEAQQGRPLHPVTVIAPSHSSALDIKHYLGRTLNNGRGSAAVRTVTLPDLADELAAAGAQLSGRAPLPAVVREGAITAVLAQAPGLFEQVADQPATARAIASTSSVLDAACPENLNNLPRLVREVARVHRSATAALGARWYTGHERYTAATTALGTPQAARRLGSVLGFQLAPEHDPSAAAFRTALDSQHGITHLTAASSLTEDETVLSASDADDEARAVVRLVIERLAANEPGHRIGVFYSAADPYRTLLARRLTEAGIEFVGAGARGLADSALARGLANLLSLDPAAPDVRIILDTLSQGSPNWRDGELPSSAVCERLHAHPPEDTEEDEATEDLPDFEKQRRQNYARFTEFVAILGERLARLFNAGSWTAAAAGLTDFVDEFFAPRQGSPELEPLEARKRVTDLLRELDLLEGIAPAPSAAAIRAAVSRGIDSGRFWAGSSGTGVVLGSYADGVGRDLDTVFIVGAADGLAPARIRENPLLPDAAIPLLAAPLPTVHERAAAAKDQFQRLLATGTRRTVLYPRGSLRAGGGLSPSRWLGEAKIRDLQSFAHGLTHGDPSGLAATPQEWRVRRLLTEGPDSDAVDRVLAAALEVRDHRRIGTFSRFNGNLAAVAGSIIDPDVPISPTNLEDWVISPLGYFLRRILKAELFEDVTLEVQISHMQRGNLMHQVLEDYVLELTSGSHPDARRLLEIAEKAFEDTANPAWLKHTWDRDKSRMRADLAQVHDADDAARQTGWTHIGVEAEFGVPEEEHPVELDLPDGSTVRFRGKVDRVDRHSDGQVLVIDYKTGKSDKYKSLKESDPTAGGTRFQLPVYGLFARRFRQDNTAEVRAEYRFITARGDYRSVGYAVTDDVVATLRADAGLIMAALRAGVFPPRPESDRGINHTTMMGAAGVRHTWERLQADPALSDYSRFFQEEK
ncbi:PD-(D/E)XK nuclease family protein [Arthrobacter sp. zg-Y1116]|uniref:PD-(D/E)XK nuclease family protein n=1 Tax=Arthrobacter sp. zg-Y1116 TaxID=2964611 RepID=UPI0021033554|nr:PD-(D/E)XK nuclease family protein [Arthrobacter sp. zg-Y1116]MCQ1947564.1 PD-(D/E)XK nuclease family protein [Arthrobacter sp. zg-Y1116]